MFPSRIKLTDGPDSPTTTVKDWRHFTGTESHGILFHDEKELSEWWTEKKVEQPPPSL